MLLFLTSIGYKAWSFLSARKRNFEVGCRPEPRFSILKNYSTLTMPNNPYYI